MALKAKISADKVKRLQELLKELKKPVDQATANAAGKATVAAMKQLIARGVSPIKGNGRFPGYKNPDKYPGGKKPNRPVNLKDTGQFLYSLTYDPVASKNGFDTVIYYDGKEANDKETGHREGANGQRERPTIPLRGESFSETIRIAFSKIYRQRLSDLIRKGKGR